MAISNVMSKVNDIERAYDVKAWKVNDLNIWPLIRLTNKVLLSDTALGNKEGQIGLGFSKIIKRFNFRAFVPKIGFVRRFRKSLIGKEVIFLSDGVSFVDLNGVMYERFCDPILDEYKKRSVQTLLCEVSKVFKEHTHTPVVNLQSALDGIMISSLIRSKLRPKASKLKFELAGYDGFLESNLPYKPSQEDLRLRYHKIFDLKEFFIALLKDSQVKKAFIVSYYYDAGMAFNWACRELGIMSIDIQHGVQGDLHLAYGGWLSVPKKGYDLLPNIFWVWSQSEFSAIHKWSAKISAHNAFIGGNMFANKWQTADVAPELMDFDYLFRKLIKNSKPVILVTLSPNTEALMHNTWQAIKNTQHDFNWCIRLHPNMLGDEQFVEKQLKQKGIMVESVHEFSVLPLYSILRNVDLHITAVSSTVIEAYNFGVPSIVTSVYGFELYEDIAESGKVVFGSSIENIESSIRVLSRQEKFRSSANVKSNKDILELFETTFN